MDYYKAYKKYKKKYTTLYRGVGGTGTNDNGPPLSPIRSTSNLTRSSDDETPPLSSGRVIHNLLVFYQGTPLKQLIVRTYSDINDIIERQSGHVLGLVSDEDYNQGIRDFDTVVNDNQVPDSIINKILGAMVNYRIEVLNSLPRHDTRITDRTRQRISEELEIIRGHIDHHFSGLTK